VPPRSSARRRARPLRAVGVLLLCALLGAVGLFLIRTRTIVVTLSEAQVQQRLETAFPVRKEVLVVAEVVLSRPQVTLTPGSDRVEFATDCVVHLLGKSVIRGRAYLSGGLGFDPARSDLFLRDARVERLEVPGLPSSYNAAVAAAASEAAGEYLAKQPVYRLPNATRLAVPLLGEFRIRDVTVENGLLKVALGRGT